MNSVGGGPGQGVSPPWKVAVYLDRRRRSPVEDFLDKQSPADRKKVERKLRNLRDRTRIERPETIGRPLVETLRGRIKELRATDQIRILFAWIYESRTILLLEADRKRNGKVSETVIARAKENLDEWESR
jgi:hypothetical protein